MHCMSIVVVYCNETIAFFHESLYMSAVSSRVSPRYVFLMWMVQLSLIVFTCRSNTSLE